MSRSPSKQHVLAVYAPAMLACILWGSAFVAIKLGYRNYGKPFSFAGVRFMLAGLLLVPFWLRSPQQFRVLKSQAGLILKICFFNNFLLYALFYEGMMRVPAALAAIVVGAGPLIGAVMSHMLMSDDRMSRGRTAAILLGMSGIALIALQRDFGTAVGWSELLGMGLLLASSVSGVFGNIVLAKHDIRLDVNPVMLNSIQIFLGGAALFAVSLVWEGRPDFSGLPVSFWFTLLWLAIISAGAFSMWFAMLKRPEIKVSSLNQCKFIIPVAGAVLSWLILPQEHPTLPMLAGMAVILAALALYAHFSRGR
jgi:drug/metabolite transporter (DMT)-like permease